MNKIILSSKNKFPIFVKTNESDNFILEFEKNMFIVKKRWNSFCFYIIKEGIVHCKDENGKIIRILKEGEIFGELNILCDILNDNVVAFSNKVICFNIIKSKSMLSKK